MLDKVIAIGERRVEEYKIRNTLNALVNNDIGLLGSLLWEAFRKGHSFPISNLLLADKLHRSNTPYGVDDLIAVLNHPEFAWNTHRASDDSRCVYWADSFPHLIKVAIHDSATELLARTQDVKDPQTRMLLNIVLVLTGHLGTEVIPDDTPARLAASWLLNPGNMRNSLNALRPAEEDKDSPPGFERLWPDTWWRKVVEVWCEESTRDVRSNAYQFEPIWAEATPEELMVMLPRLRSVDPHHATRIGAAKPELRTLVEKRAEGLLKKLNGASLLEVELIAAFLMHFYEKDEAGCPPERFDPLLSRVIKERFGGRRTELSRDNYLSDHAIHPEHIARLPIKRREVVVMNEQPAWQFAAVCPTKKVLRPWVAAVVASTGNISYDQKRYLKTMLTKEIGPALAPYVCEVIGQSFTRRPILLDALFVWRETSTLPTLIKLLGADKQTRLAVSKGLKEWGAPVLEHLGSALTAKAVKVRTEAANVLAALTASPRALEMAAERLPNESSAAVRAILEPLAMEHEARANQPRDAVEMQRPDWRMRRDFDRAMKRSGGWETLVEWGPDAIAELVHWFRERSETEHRLAFWKNRLRLREIYLEHERIPRKRLVVNVQRFVFRCARALADTSDRALELKDERDALRWMGEEEEGLEHLVAKGPAVLAVMARELDPMRTSRGRSPEFFNDHFDDNENIWENVEQLFREFLSQDGVEEALQTINQAMDNAEQRTELLGQARALIAPYRRPLTVEEQATFDEEHTDHFGHYHMRNDIGEAALNTMLEHLIERDARGGFDDIWRCDVIPYDAWHNLVRVCLHFAPEQLAELDADRIKALKDDDSAWQSPEDGDALEQLSATVALVAEGGEKDFSKQPTLEWAMRENVTQLIERFAPSQDVAEPLAQIASIINQRSSESDMKMVLELIDSWVLNNDKRSDDEQRALVERLTLLMQAQEHGRRTTLYSWLAGRIDPQRPEASFALETLIAGLNDTKKDVRQAVRTHIIRNGIPVLERIWPLLTSKKITPRREAAEIVYQVSHPTSLPYIDAAIAREKKDDIIQVLQLARIECQPLPELSKLSDAKLDKALVKRSENLPALPDFAQPEKLHKVRWSGGKAVSTQAMNWILCQLMRETHSSSASGVAQVCARLDASDKDALAVSLNTSRGERFQKEPQWVDYALYHLASDALLESLVRRFDFISNRQRHRGYAIIDVLARRATDLAVRLLATLTHSTARTAYRNQCRWRLDRIARARKLSVPELIEEATPTLGFDDNAHLSVELGTPLGNTTAEIGADGVVRWRLGDTLHDDLDALEADSGHTLPGELRAELASITTHTHELVELERERLNEAMIVARTWSVERFSELFRHPIRRVASQGLVWTTSAIDDALSSKPATCFSLSLEGGCLDVSGEAFVLPENAEVRVIHAAELDESSRRQWQAWFFQEGLHDPIDQLCRPLYPPENIENSFEAVLETIAEFESGRDVRRAVYRMGFEPLHVEGSVYEAYRSYANGISVSLHHDAYSLSSMNMSEELALTGVSIQAHNLLCVPPGLHSEVVCLLKAHLPAAPA